MSKKILILTGDAVEALEVFYPYYRCLEEGFDATIAAPAVKKINTVVHDFEDWDTYTEKQAYKLDSHAAFSDIKPEEYDGLIIPGGRAPEHIRMNEYVPSIVEHFFQEGKPIAAICHASLIFTVINRELLKNREMSAYIACKPEVESVGATYINKPLHVDNNLVSGHAWPDLPAVMKEFIGQLHK
ncbi:DJ-1/PfpI family protein [Priestia filamentosa]|uniref:DJ-1/PfpI family protein n=1 Tax=Priestia filamentosa TaxID=1402861 RepID=UPI001FB2B692|nr:DJ-1/PfpI family protein [Priestia filamentosa]MED3727250.1 DJ-1/PfpI family protein [Priestia filamentosa]UOE59379.1 DJ-1/PfpI family protein [Priestia filamentosa]